MHIRLSVFLDKHNIIFDHQFGFQENKSTSLALLYIFNSFTNNIEQNSFTCCILLDFSKAFDTVNHDILLSKLDHYGVRGLPHPWFQSYLRNRTERVCVSGQLSNIGLLSKLRHYIPQNTLKNLYNALIIPHVNYGLTCWGSAYSSNLEPIRISLRKAVRTITFAK